MSAAFSQQSLYDFYDRGLYAAKAVGGDCVLIAERFASRGVTAVIPRKEIESTLLAFQCDKDPHIRDSKPARKKFRRELRDAIDRGHANRTGQLLDEDSLEREGRLADIVETGVLRKEAEPKIRARMREALGERTISEATFTHEQLRDEPTLPDVIEGVLPQSALATLVGSSGLGKTAMGLSMAAAVAMGRPWMGRPTQSGKVIYFIAEGGSGIAKRLDAISTAFYAGRAIENLIIVRRPVDMTDTHGEVAEIRALVAEIDPELLFFDTLIRYAGGAEENSSTGMSLVLANMEWVARAGTRTTAIAVHHTGHEGTRARGTSAIYANVDAELTLSGEPSALKLTATKMKDGRQGLLGEFKLTESREHDSIFVEGIAPGQGQPSGAQAARVEEALALFVGAFGVTGATRPALVKSLAEWMSVSEASVQRYIGDLLKDGRLVASMRGRSTYLELSPAAAGAPSSDDSHDLPIHPIKKGK